MTMGKGKPSKPCIYKHLSQYKPGCRGFGWIPDSLPSPGGSWSWCFGYSYCYTPRTSPALLHSSFCQFDVTSLLYTSWLGDGLLGSFLSFNLHLFLPPLLLSCIPSPPIAWKLFPKDHHRRSSSSVNVPEGHEGL